MAFLPALWLYQNPLRSMERGCRGQVLVRDNNVDQALNALKKKMQREGIFREMKLRGHYEKPSEQKAREKAEAIPRAPPRERRSGAPGPPAADPAPAMGRRARHAEWPVGVLGCGRTEQPARA